MTAAVLETTSKVPGSAVNVAELRAGLVLTARTVDLLPCPRTWLGAMVLLEVALMRPETRKSAAAMVDAIGVLLVPVVRAANWGANALRAARAASKCVYLMHSRRVRVLKRTTVDCPEMTETAAAAVGSVGFVLLLTTQAANVWTARAAASRVSYLLLLLLLVRLARAPAPGEMYDLTAAVAQMVGGKVMSTAQVAECRAAQVQTTRAESN